MRSLVGSCSYSSSQRMPAKSDRLACSIRTELLTSPPLCTLPTGERDWHTGAVALYVGKAAALLCQKSDQTSHALKIRAVVKKAAITSRADQPCALKVLQMKRDRRRGDTHLVDQVSRRIAVRPALHQQAIDRQPRLLSEGTKRKYGIFRFHDFNSMKSSNTTPATISVSSATRASRSRRRMSRVAAICTSMRPSSRADNSSSATSTIRARPNWSSTAA